MDRLRSATRGMVEARTQEALAAAGENLAAAVQQVGVARWPRYLADAERRAIAAVSGGNIPGVVKVGAADSALGAGGLIFLGVLGLAHQASRNGTPGVSGNRDQPPNVLMAAPPRDAKDPNGAKAPGKPGEAEGF